MNIRENPNTFLCGIPSILWVSFQADEFSPEGYCFGQCLSGNTIFHATDDMFSESPQHSTLTQLTTKSTALYILICGEGPQAKKEGEEQRAGAGPLACSLSFQAVRLSLRWLSLSVPLGFLEELGGQCRDDSCNRNYWMHVDGAVRPCLAAQVLPVPFSQTKGSRINTRFVDVPWQDHLGTLQTGMDCSPIQLSTRRKQNATKSSLGPHYFPAFVLFLNSVGSLLWEVWTPKGL